MKFQCCSYYGKEQNSDKFYMTYWSQDCSCLGIQCFWNIIPALENVIAF
jgi:hypothetical protein